MCLMCLQWVLIMSNINTDRATLEELAAWSRDGIQALEVRRRVFHAVCDYCRKTKLQGRLESNTLRQAKKERQGTLFDNRKSEA